jgi:NAD(P) transhydrogenase subunit alpha
MLPHGMSLLLAMEATAGKAAGTAATAAAPADFIMLLTVFVLAIFIGFEIITKVPPTLHTPLMSGSNAISGITVIGALILAGTTGSQLIGMFALIFAMVNVVGGFLVTHRMLQMFQKKKG